MLTTTLLNIVFHILVLNSQSAAGDTLRRQSLFLPYRLRVRTRLTPIGLRNRLLLACVAAGNHIEAGVERDYKK
jgi:hypothetical protein